MAASDLLKDSSVQTLLYFVSTLSDSNAILPIESVFRTARASWNTSFSYLVISSVHTQEIS